jgi:UDP-N-acetylmuramyl pentapeptide synthase
VDWFEEVAEAASALRGQIAPGDVVLVKGSRSARMERIMEEVEGP